MKRLAILLAMVALSVPLAYAQSSGAVHMGTGVVRSVDAKNGTVTLKHDPIKSLNWPTMTMAFTVKDKAMLDKLAKDKKVEFEFVRQGQQFVITSIK
jgi:Cu(I)/Ag(I) efflux system protein CusF